MPLELDFPILNFTAISPMLVITMTAIVVMILDMFTKDKTLLGYVSLMGLVGSLMPCFVLLSRNGYPTFQNMLMSDGYAVIFYIIFIATAILSSLIAVSYLEDRGIEQGEYHILLLLATIGMMTMAAATDLIIVFMGLEIMSIALYVMAAFNRKQMGSSEAGLKYFLLGAFASAFFLYGVAFVYGATGSTNLYEIGEALSKTGQGDLFATVGFSLLMVGFSFKVAAVPFQWWTPDVYQGAPTSATAFMSVGAKAAGFAALVRVLMVSFVGTMALDWQIIVAFIALVTMTIGNVTALAQKDVKRMLAYSSIAHAGYILVGVVALDGSAQTAISGILLYLISYTFMNIGALAVVSVLEKRESIGSHISEYTGLASRQPMLAFCMLLFMFGLTGIPPFIGFWGKWYVFWAAVEAGFSWLAVIGMVNSAISAFYYIGVVVQMYMHAPDDSKTEFQPITISGPIRLTLVIAGILTVLFGLWPTPLITLTGLGLLG